MLFRAVCEAKSMLRASDRALAVLSALLSFHLDSELSSEGGLVVFPSNRQLSLRAHGMAPATLRRHLAVLVECRLAVRRDTAMPCPMPVLAPVTRIRLPLKSNAETSLTGVSPSRRDRHPHSRHCRRPSPR